MYRFEPGMNLNARKWSTCDSHRKQTRDLAGRRRSLLKAQSKCLTSSFKTLALLFTGRNLLGKSLNFYVPHFLKHQVGMIRVSPS